MIFGILDRHREASELGEDLLRVATRLTRGRKTSRPTVWTAGHLAACVIPTGIDTLDELPQPFLNEDRTIAVLWEGKIYNLAEIKRSLGADHDIRTDCSGEALPHLYEKYQDDLLDQVNGKFAFALWDERSQRLLLGRDHFGIEPLFYYNDSRRLIFSSSLRPFLVSGWVTKELNHEAVLQYLLYCYNPGDHTFLKNVHKLPAGYLLSSNGSGASLRPYWRLSFADVQVKTHEQHQEEILRLIDDAIRIRLDPHRPPGVFLSGGIDSSTIVSLTSRMRPEPLSTFSFRCEGRSYDESPYARFVADHYGTRHTEIPYSPDGLSLISGAVEFMDEPFCDAGIEIGTYLLGQAAHGQVSYVFSGEGGDELFAGHPVYVADKLAAMFDRLPGPLVRPAARALQRIPDSHQKKNLQVKVKRFAYGLSFPPELLSHRWRVYYTPEELRQLCSDGFIGRCDMQAIFDPVLKYNAVADGPDQLSRSLQSDYRTLVAFYLRRLGLLRAFALESRLPLLDPRLAQYAATIPSSLKIRGFSDTKYIYRRALETVLPPRILHGRPKLGHSVPMKNWLRHESLQKHLHDRFSDGPFAKRGLLRAQAIQKMFGEHIRKRQNNSHRLWALLVLETWLTACWD